VHRYPTIILSAATVVAALGLSGCTTAGPPAATPSSVVSAATPAGAPLPDPAALIDVLARLSDPAVPGVQKLALVEGSTEADAGALDAFARALADNHALPLGIAATDLAFSDRDPANVTAEVTITPAGAEPDRAFSFPMEFTPAGAAWRLSRQTANLLLTINAGPPAPPPGALPPPGGAGEPVPAGPQAPAPAPPPGPAPESPPG